MNDKDRIGLNDLREIVEKVIDNIRRKWNASEPEWDEKFYHIKSMKAKRQYEPEYRLICTLDELLRNAEHENIRFREDRSSSPYGNITPLSFLINLPKPLYKKLCEALKRDVDNYCKEHYGNWDKLIDFVEKNAKKIEGVFYHHYHYYEEIYQISSDEIIGIIFDIYNNHEMYVRESTDFVGNVELPLIDADKYVGKIRVEYDIDTEDIIGLKEKKYYNSTIIKLIDGYIKAYNQKYIYDELSSIITKLVNEDLNHDNTKYTIETLKIIQKWLKQQSMDYSEFLVKKKDQIMKLIAKEKAKGEDNINIKKNESNNNEYNIPRIVGTSEEVKANYKKTKIIRQYLKYEIPQYVYDAMEMAKIDIFDEEFVYDYYQRLQSAIYYIHKLEKTKETTEVEKIYDKIINLKIGSEELVYLMKRSKLDYLIKTITESRAIKLDFNSNYMIVSYLRLNNASEEQIQEYLKRINELKVNIRSAGIVDLELKKKVSEGLDKYLKLCIEYYESVDKSDVVLRLRRIIVEYDLQDADLIGIEIIAREKMIQKYGEDYIIKQEKNEGNKRKK